MKHKSFIVTLIWCLCISACQSDRPEDNNNATVVINNGAGVYISFEGNFQFGNAKVAYYNIEKDVLSDDLYQAANGVTLGDVCQSMYFYRGNIYIVVNNSGKIEVVDDQSFERKAVINGLKSPRYFLPVSASKAYVTDLYANFISVVDLNSNSVINRIPCAGWTEEMQLVYGKVFVTNPKKNQLYVINTTTDILEDSIAIGYGANSIVVDKYARLWVLCSGDAPKEETGGLYRIDASDKKVELYLPFSDKAVDAKRLDINSNLDTLYYLNKHVYQMPIANNRLPDKAFIDSGDRVFYGIGLEPRTGNIYVADAIDYVQRGKIYRYTPDGRLIHSFLAHVIPGEFYFR